jgi:BirA family biotin operon repressor/biotin-[acetyl-CoA-carboxylase] ligase
MIQNTIFTGKLLIHQPEMLSTNDFAKDILSKTNPIDGTVILTDSQTKGKGQGSHQWASQPYENLTFSIIYHTHFLLANQQFFISMAIANGVHQALKMLKLGHQFFIKWPNDIFCMDKKLGGILIENSIMGRYLKYSVIGIGLNVNQTLFDNLPNATSLKLIGNDNYHLMEILSLLCSTIESQFLLIRSGKTDAIFEYYNNHLYQLEKEVHFKVGNQMKHGILKSVNHLGQLGILMGSDVHFYNHGEIKM